MCAMLGFRGGVAHAGFRDPCVCLWVGYRQKDLVDRRGRRSMVESAIDEDDED